MKASYKQLYNAINNGIPQRGLSSSLHKLMGNDQLAPAIKLRLSRIGDKIDQEIKRAEGQREALIKKNPSGIEDSQRGWLIPDDAPRADLQEFTRDWEPILDEIVELPGKQIPFEAVSGAPLNAGDLMVLNWLIALPAEQEEDQSEEKAAAAIGD